MKFLALIKDTFRECLGKKILISYFLISTLGILTMMFVVNIKITGANAVISTLIGNKNENLGLPELTNSIVFAESMFARALYSIGIFLSIFATVDLMPGLMKKGRLDLYLARPLSRPLFLLGKFTGAVAVASVNIIYAMAGFWLVLGIKTHVWNFSFLYSMVVIIFMFAVLYTIMMLISILAKNTAVAIIVIYMVMTLETALGTSKSLFSMISNTLLKHALEILYWILPKHHEVASITQDIAGGKSIESWTPLLSSFLTALIVMNIAVFLFSKKDL
ncbi:MAG: ABC transporter permease subunit [Candidatus Latescibacteria bacterium]|nr:ABC transporter permease subunit [Candidatus Latescibacterota bacterium]